MVQYSVSSAPGSPTRLHLSMLKQPGPGKELTPLDSFLDDVPE